MTDITIRFFSMSGFVIIYFPIGIHEQYLCLNSCVSDFWNYIILSTHHAGGFEKVKIIKSIRSTCIEDMTPF